MQEQPFVDMNHIVVNSNGRPNWDLNPNPAIVNSVARCRVKITTIMQFPEKKCTIILSTAAISLLQDRKEK